MNKSTIIKTAVIAAVIIIPLLIFGVTRANNNDTPSGTVGGKITFDKTSYAWNDISAAKGEVTATFKLTNDSDESLELTGMKTSCACTSAVFIRNGERSMKFSMHTPASRWSMTLNPRETIDVEVTFDPNFHKGQRGPLTRIIYISSSDSTKPVAELKLTGNVVD